MTIYCTAAAASAAANTAAVAAAAAGTAAAAAAGTIGADAATAAKGPPMIHRVALTRKGPSLKKRGPPCPGPTGFRAQRASRARFRSQCRIPHTCSSSSSSSSSNSSSNSSSSKGG
ncbi:hypothetical protein Emed_001872 [Eimeria media]